jgi:hypothetical protein
MTFFVKEVPEISYEMEPCHFSSNLDHIGCTLTKFHEVSSFISIFHQFTGFLEIYQNWVKFELQV